MLGSTMTITLDGSGGTAKVLPLINNDDYGAEYFLDETLKSYRCFVKHSKENVKPGTQDFERHSITFECFTKPTTTFPLGQRTQVTHTIRRSKDGVVGDDVDLSEAMSFITVKAGGLAPKLLGWES